MPVFNPPGLVKISEQVGTGASGVLTFSAIPGSYRELELTVTGRSDTAATLATLRLAINGDATATNYDNQNLIGIGASPSSSEALGSQAYIDAGAVPGANSTANLMGSTKIWLPEYANTTAWKNILIQAAATTTLASNGMFSEQIIGAYESALAITSLTITLSAGSWTLLSRATLWGKF